MDGNLIEFGDHIDQLSPCMENLESVQSTEVSQPVNAMQSTLKNKRSTVKRKITIHLKSLAALVEQCGSKTRIDRIMADLRLCLQQAEEFNVQYLSFVPETEHDKVLEWYDVEFCRVNEALDEAVVHLEERAGEEASLLSSVISRKSKSLHKSGKDPVTVKAKAAAAQAYAKKQKELANEKLREIESQAELQRKLLKAKEDAERALLELVLELEKQRSMSEEAQKTRQLEAEAIRLKVEVQALENKDYGQESLEQRMKDFEGEEGETNSILPDNGTDLPASGNPTAYPSTPKRGTELQQSKVKFGQREVITNGDLQPDSTTRTIVLRSSLDSLPKLKLDTFAGDPIHWSDWISMFRSIIDDADISCNAKMQHLQNAVTGRAKDAIAGYGYSGELYAESLQKLESRFGKSHIVVKAHLNRLQKWSKLSDERLHEVRRFSDVVSAAVKTFERLGYVEDLHAANNLNMVVDKLSPSLCVKWKEYKRDKGLTKANLLDFEKWIEVQADVHEDFGARANNPPFKFRGRNANSPLVYSAFAPPDEIQYSPGEHTQNANSPFVYSAFAPPDEVRYPPGEYLRPKGSGRLPSVPCVMGDTMYHKLQNCPKFKVLSVQERLEKVKEYGLCFRCFGQHWSNRCRSNKQCGINGCTKLHNELLHRLTTDNGSSTSPPHPEVPPAQHSSPEPQVESSNVMQGSNKSRVLLQVIPVTLYGPGGQLNTHALLDPGSSCSLVMEDIADQLSLDGPSESLNLFGIRVTSHLKTKRVSFDISPVNAHAIRYPVENVLVVERLNLPPVTVNMESVKSQWSHLVDLELKDMDGAEVKVVLGSDVTEIIIPREVREGPKGSPFGVKTKLGWAVTGNLPGYVRNSESVYFVHVASPEEELNELVKTWWNTESFGCKYDSKERHSREDEMILESLNKTTRKVDGRYEVGLIWKDSATSLPNNRVIAERRLELLEKRLERDSQLKIKYTETIENDLHKGYIKKLGNQELAVLVAHEWYLPHHPVLHPHKPGRVRRVGDAAALYQGTSLNDYLLSEPDQWCHCPGKLNPADDGSRGLRADAITSGSRWLNGPAFLLLPEDQWPEDIPKTKPTLDRIADAPAEVVQLAEVTSKISPQFMDLSKYSLFGKVCRITAYVRRFIWNCRSKLKGQARTSPLEVQEIKEAKLMWIKSAQREAFSHEISNIEAGRPIGVKSRLITLTPFLDESHILRVGGRIGGAAVPYDVKHPVIIPQDHQLSRLIILDCHKKLNHEGSGHVRNKLRLMYWISHSRSTVRRVLLDCSLCKRRRIKPQPPLMASLPKGRLQVLWSHHGQAFSQAREALWVSFYQHGH